MTSGSAISAIIAGEVSAMLTQLTVCQRLAGAPSPSLARGAATAALFVLCLAAGVGSAAAQSESLQEARRLYNAGRYEEAVSAARSAAGEAALRHEALLVSGRAGLERYRQTADRGDLEQAREALRSIDASRLDYRERVDLVVGLAEALYLDDQFAVAAEVFDSAIERSSELGPGARDQVLDWWATALDRDAHGRPEAQRAETYDRIINRMKAELRRNPGTAAASYWLVAAARAKGDLEGAWDAAMAGWVRAQLTRDRGAALRPDLDRLVLQGIIPERVRRLSPAGADLEQSIAGMAAEWELFKEKWTYR
jgi:tetratricopeptide (TPR) repeat protein